MAKAPTLGPDPNPAVTKQNMEAVKNGGRADSDADE